jgi:hypothetical protein
MHAAKTQSLQQLMQAVEKYSWKIREGSLPSAASPKPLDLSLLGPFLAKYLRVLIRQWLMAAPKL